jgi:hypothetical protein
MVDQRSTPVARQTGRITYQYLKEITDNFSQERELGAGASGKVFRVGPPYHANLLYNTQLKMRKKTQHR